MTSLPSPATSSPGVMDSRRSYFDLYPERRGKGPYVPSPALTPKLRSTRDEKEREKEKERERERRRVRAEQREKAKLKAAHEEGVTPSTPSTPTPESPTTGRAAAQEARAFLLAATGGRASPRRALPSSPPPLLPAGAEAASSSASTATSRRSERSKEDTDEGYARQWHSREPRTPRRTLETHLRTPSSSTPASALSSHASSVASSFVSSSASSSSRSGVDIAAAAAARSPAGYPAQPASIARRRSKQDLATTAAAISTPTLELQLVEEYEYNSIPNGLTSNSNSHANAYTSTITTPSKLPTYALRQVRDDAKRAAAAAASSSFDPNSNNSPLLSPNTSSYASFSQQQQQRISTSRGPNSAQNQRQGGAGGRSPLAPIPDSPAMSMRSIPDELSSSSSAGGRSRADSQASSSHHSNASASGLGVGFGASMASPGRTSDERTPTLEQGGWTLATPTRPTSLAAPLKAEALSIAEIIRRNQPLLTAKPGAAAAATTALRSPTTPNSTHFPTASSSSGSDFSLPRTPTAPLSPSPALSISRCSSRASPAPGLAPVLLLDAASPPKVRPSEVRATFAGSSRGMGKSAASTAPALKCAPSQVPSIEDIIRGHARGLSTTTTGATAVSLGEVTNDVALGDRREASRERAREMLLGEEEEEREVAFGKQHRRSATVGSAATDASESDAISVASSAGSVEREVVASLKAERRKYKAQRAAQRAAEERAWREAALESVGGIRGANWPSAATTAPALPALLQPGRTLHHATSFPSKPTTSEFGQLNKPVSTRRSAGAAPGLGRSRTGSGASTTSASASFARAQPGSAAAAAAHAAYGGGIPLPLPNLEEASVTAYLRSAKLTRLVPLARAPYAGLTVSLADVGDTTGHPVVVFLGLGAVRYLVGLYDEMACALGLRLICIDRWGMGKTDDVPAERRSVLEWAGVVAEVLDQLDITRYSILAHSAGAPYAMATTLFARQKNDGAKHVAGPVHLLAPWVGASVESGYKWLKYVPDGVIKTAQAAEWRMQGWKLGKLPNLTYEAVGYDAKAANVQAQTPWALMSASSPNSPSLGSPTGEFFADEDGMLGRQASSSSKNRFNASSPSLQVPEATGKAGSFKGRSSGGGLFGAFFGTSATSSGSRSPTLDEASRGSTRTPSPSLQQHNDASSVRSFNGATPLSPTPRTGSSSTTHKGQRSPIPRWPSSSSLKAAAQAQANAPISPVSRYVPSRSPSTSSFESPSTQSAISLLSKRASLRAMRRSSSGQSVANEEASLDTSYESNTASLRSTGSMRKRASGSWGRGARTPRNGSIGSASGIGPCIAAAATAGVAQAGSYDSSPTGTTFQNHSSISVGGAPSVPAPRASFDLPTALLRASHAESLRGGTADLLTILGRTSQKPWGFTYADVEHPTVVWHGDRDERISLSGVMWMEREMRDCCLHVVKGAGHGLMTNIDVVVEALESISNYRHSG